MDTKELVLPHRATPGYAVEAVIHQLSKWHSAGGDNMPFKALSEHPETDEDCTIGDLLPQARAELAVRPRALGGDRQTEQDALYALLEVLAPSDLNNRGERL